MAPKRRRRSISSSGNNTRSDPNPDPDRLIAELFREASALAATTGARVAVLARKPNGEVRRYGCPNVSSVLDRCVPPAAAAEASEEEEMVDRYVAAPANNGALLDRILRRYLERKRAEDPSYGEAAARDKEWKDLQWQREILYRLRERVIAGHGN